MVYFYLNQCSGAQKSKQRLYFGQVNKVSAFVRSSQKTIKQGKDQEFLGEQHQPYTKLKQTKVLTKQVIRRPSLVVQMEKNQPAMWETWVRSLGWKDPLEKGMAIQSSILAWRIPQTEELGGLQSTGLQSQTRLKRLSTHAHTTNLVGPSGVRVHPAGKYILSLPYLLSTSLKESYAKAQILKTGESHS